MLSTPYRGVTNPLGALQRLAAKSSELEQCDFCSVSLETTHRHVLELATRKILCTCTPCGLRFEGVVGGKYKLIPRRARILPHLQLSEEQWASLGLPVELAFIFQSSLQKRPIALYPSPGGPIESSISLVSWEALLASQSRLAKMEADTEALLVNRTGQTRDYFVAPIDACFELAGLIRAQWKGLTGGTTVWQEVGAFFSRLRSGATPAGPISTEGRRA
jgi:hypothetical protein